MRCFFASLLKRMKKSLGRDGVSRSFGLCHGGVSIVGVLLKANATMHRRTANRLTRINAHSDFW